MEFAQSTVIWGGRGLAKSSYRSFFGHCKNPELLQWLKKLNLKFILLYLRYVWWKGVG